MTSIVEVIQHYQRSIDSSQDNEARLLHCINKLYKLPIKVEHLQETGVGKTVNSLRKFNGEIGMAAKTLVTKWKAMVAAEEEPMDTSSQNNENETPKNDNDDAGSTPRDDEDDENLNRNNTSQQLEQSKHRSGDKKDKSKDRHKEGSGSSSGHKDSKSSSSSSSHHHGSEKSSKHSSDKHKITSSSSSKDKDRSNSDHHSSSNNKDKGREKEKTDHKSRKENHIDKDDKHDKDKKRDEKTKKDKEHKTETSSATHSSHHKSKSHSSSSSSSKSKHEDSHSHTSSKEKERSERAQKSASKDKERTKDEKSSSSSHSSSKDKPEHKPSTTHLSSTSKSSTKDSESSERKRRHNSDDDSTDFKSPQPKMAKTQKSTKLEASPPQEEEETDECFDSSMGANFDDVLGMLNMPKKKSKKPLKSPTTPSSGSSTSSKKDGPPLKATNATSNSNSSGGNDSSKLNGSRTAIPSSLYSTPTTSKINTMKPDLLAPTAKLEPLDPSIALELPTISTNYKPMPLNQTVMDCVFNNSFNSKPPVRTLTDAEAMSHGISSKTIRTKIYSGVKTGQTYQVPTLFDMCIRILQKNIDALEYTGGVPFEVLKPVLDRATPHQLYVFEEYNPYLMEDSDVLWQQHVSRTFRTKKRLENESWREMFIRCQDEEERRLSVLKDSIKASQKIAAAPVRKTQLAFVDSMVKPPRNILKKQEQYGTKSKLVATPAARVASLSSVTPNAAKTGDQRLRVPATVRDHAQVSSSAIRTKKAPLMQKTLQFIRGRHKR